MLVLKFPCPWTQAPYGGIVRVMNRSGTENVYRGVSMKDWFQVIAQGW